MTIDLAELAADHFRPHLGEPFQFQLPDGSALELILKEVEETPRTRMPNAPPERRIPFSLLLTGRDPNHPLISDSLPLHHAALGTLPPLLITRVMSTNGLLDPEAWYQICFN